MRIHGDPSAENHTGDACGRSRGGIDVWSVSNVYSLVCLGPKPSECHFYPARAWLELPYLGILSAHNHVEKSQQVHRLELCRCRIIREYTQPPSALGGKLQEFLHTWVSQTWQKVERGLLHPAGDT